MRRKIRSVTRLLVFVSATVASAATLFALGQAMHPAKPDVSLDATIGIRHHLANLGAVEKNPGVHSVVFMGDSTVVGYPKGRTVDVHLRNILVGSWAGRGRVHVESLSEMGMTPAGFYLLQDLISDAGPDIAIVTANLPLIRELLPPALRRPELAGWLQPRRMFATLVDLDLHKFGVTADALLLHKAFVSAGASTWISQRQQQARLGYLRGAVEDFVADTTSWTTERETRNARLLLSQASLVDANDPTRRNPKSARSYVSDLMAGVDDDHWVLEVLHAILSDFRAAGILTVLYVPPINVDRLRAVGVYNDAGVEKTLAALQRLAEATGAEFADLHALLPDAVFRDGGGHYKHEAPHDGPQMVAQALAPYVQLQLLAASQAR